MQIVMIKSDKLYKYPFPDDNITSYTITDYDNSENERSLITLERKDDNWLLVSSNNCYICENSNEKTSEELVLNKFYLLKIKNINVYTNALLFVYEENDSTFESYQLLKDGSYTIGNGEANIIMKGNYINKLHAVITKNENNYIIESKDSNFGIYVNNIKVSSKNLFNGDVIFILGFRIIFINNYFIINNFNNGLIINDNNIIIKPMPEYINEISETIDDDNAKLYNDNDYYSRSPRFITSINAEDFKIDSPPQKQEEDNTPVILTVGPMLTMALSSCVSAATSVVSIVNNKDNSFWSAVPGIVIAVAMLTSTLLWPTLMRKYNKNKTKKKEEERQKKYLEYLIEKRKKIENFKVNQSQLLLENYPDAKGLETIIYNRKRNLWQRTIESDDFLCARVGLGNVPLKIKLSYAVEEFSMTEDNLKNELEKVGKSAEDIINAPVTINLIERNKLVLIGEKQYRDNMLKYLLLQLATYHSYTDLKIVFMVNDKISDIWKDFKVLPHTWSNSRDLRFYANNYDDMTKISFYLEQIYTSRKYTDSNGDRKESDITYRNVLPYYLIIVDNIKKNKNVEIINKVLKEKRNIGFGLLVLNDGISNLPNECNDFLVAADDKSAVMKNDLNKDNQITFKMDRFEFNNISILCERLSNIPIRVPLRLDEMKNTVGFLEIFKVGKIEQLNIFDRWVKNNPVNSLNVPIGIHADGDLFTLDLHEKFHGPHGLIAGMTGSGKSEFIITYILSMALNFSPTEVSFVLIDYKGGGLTGAFENKLANIKLPHLAGSITNLDKAEINRSLASIHSELNRRQKLFNDAKMKLNQSTLDIYKYQQLYRDKMVNEPISHLFIISDEFAELKSQQPEFMEELISTARIGRSLGVHLILATQKPAGIVDDQIWSNSKFKVCLKVQDRSDSVDVIKCPDAAELKRAGNFYLQVGYNDYFAIGQAAYAGIKYIPKDKLSINVDRTFSFINNIGDIVKSIDLSKKDEKNINLGEELPNVLNYICSAAKSKNLVARKLWLDKIPDEIFVNDLISKYKFSSSKWDIKAIIGEYDDPNNQRQDILTLDFNEKGNCLIYGVSGSGKEIMLSSIMYSLIISHTSEELNIYVVDFGSEMFNVFKSSPQIGDVVLIHEQEKLANLFNLIASELNSRKKLFSLFNGDYNLFIKNSKKKLPRLIIIINNYEVFNETYEDYVDILSGFTRECERYGISFIITASGSNSVRGKTSQNFSNIFCLQFNDPGDYGSVLGSTRGMVPSAITGRGLFKMNNQLYEFQTAYPYKWDQINSFIKEICDRLNTGLSNFNKADIIAVLPDHVRMQNVEKYIHDLKNVPIGIEKEGLKISTFNFNKNNISLISSQDSSILDIFTCSLAEVLQKVNNNNLYMVDYLENVKYSSKFNNYFSKSNIEEFANILEEKIKDNSEEKTSVFVIYGSDFISNNLSSDIKDKIVNSLNNLKNSQNVRIILSDDVSVLKQYEYDNFFKDNAQNMNGIWVGSGINDQYTFKCSTYNKQTRSQIPNDFGYNLDRGNATFIKLLDFYSND